VEGTRGRTREGREWGRKGEGDGGKGKGEREERIGGWRGRRMGIAHPLFSA